MRTVVAVAVTTTGVAWAGTSTAHADDPEPFTVVVLPDTQKYAVSDTLARSVTAQTRWIVDQRDALGVAFATHVGDVVDLHPDPKQWDRMSASMAVLDDAGVPNAVLPGNHDLDLSTGESPLYDEYFPSSRYADAAWTPASARYGGSYAPHGNRSSYSLFSAGGLDLMVLSLEYGAPDDVLAWARRVIAEHPDRRVILSTHAFLHLGGGRSTYITRTDPGANTPAQIWTELVRSSCSIFLVVNGHESSGERGEARRTDLNDCGEPVHQVLTDYQGRANGGDGWLRYYTFDPAADTITARTYSPTLGRFESDADSAFTLRYDMAPRDAVRRDLVAEGSSWAYRHAATAPPSGWRSRSFDDAGWPTGRAALGFGSWGPRTVITAPSDGPRPLGVQLRREFTVDDPADVARLSLTTRADDGVVLYLNGVEVGRRNLPAGAVTATTYATAAPSTASAVASPFTVAVPVDALRAGRNVLTAQVQLNYRATPDISFDARLRATLR